jgi:hypothetical protein
MSTNQTQQLLIVLIDKFDITHYAKDIPPDLEYIEDLHSMVQTESWIKNDIISQKPLVFYINAGEIVSTQTKIKSMDTDIMLLVYKSINYVRRTFPGSLSNITQNMSQYLSHTLSGVDLPIGYNILSNIPSNITTPATPTFTFNVQDASITSPVQSNQPSESVSTPPSDQVPSMPEYITNYISENIPNLSSDITTILNNLPIQSIVQPGDPIENAIAAADYGENNSDGTVSTSDTTPADVVDAADVAGAVDNETIVNTGLGQLSEQLQDILNGSITGIDYNDIKEKYSEGYDHMKVIGFTDDRKILQALYVCEGNIENAVNYYLSQ